MRRSTHKNVRFVAIPTTRKKVNGRQVVRFGFDNNDPQANYASNVLISFLLKMVDDDRAFSFGMLNKGESNYVDIPTAAFEQEEREIEADA